MRERVIDCEGCLKGLLLLPSPFPPLLPPRQSLRGQRHGGPVWGRGPVSVTRQGWRSLRQAGLSLTQYGAHLWNFQILFGHYKWLPGPCCCLYTNCPLGKFFIFTGPHVVHLSGRDRLTDGSRRCSTANTVLEWVPCAVSHLIFTKCLWGMEGVTLSLNAHTGSQTG